MLVKVASLRPHFQARETQAILASPGRASTVALTPLMSDARAELLSTQVTTQQLTYRLNKSEKIKHLSIQDTCNMKPLEEGEKGINELVVFNVELCWRGIKTSYRGRFLGAKLKICLRSSS